MRCRTAASLMDRVFVGEIHQLKTTTTTTTLRSNQFRHSALTDCSLASRPLQLARICSSSIPELLHLVVFLMLRDYITWTCCTYRHNVLVTRVCRAAF